MSSMLQDSEGKDNEEISPVYFVELSKSGRAECKKCDCKIENKSLRVGVMIDGEWGLLTRWQHLDCTVFPKSLPSVNSIDGFQELSAENKALVTERFMASANEVDDDTVPVNPDELVRKAWDKPLEPSLDLLMPLLPYQKEGLGWMVNQEHNDVHGGILADEMGMGKTIQAISLMLHNRPNTTEFQQMREWAASDERHGIKEELPRAGTLIVLPTVAIRQWQTEIARFTKAGALTVKVYHGSDRNTSALELTGVDIVLTSYKILEIEYRKATAGTKVTCKLCSKKFYPDKLRVHRKYFCGASAQLTEAQALTQRKKPANAFGRPDKVDASALAEKAEKGAANKRRKVSAAASAADEEEEEGASSEDEVARQKRLINERKAAAESKKKQGKGQKTKAGAAAKLKSPLGKNSSPIVAEEGSSAKSVASSSKLKAAAKVPTAVKKQAAQEEENCGPEADTGTEGSEEPAADSNYWVGSDSDGEGAAQKKTAAAAVRPSKAKARGKVKAAPAATRTLGKAKAAAAVTKTYMGRGSPIIVDSSRSSSSAVKRTSPRTQAQVPRKYCVDDSSAGSNSDTDLGDADSVYDSEAAAASEEEAEAEEEEEGGGDDTGSASDSKDPTSEDGGTRRDASGRGRAAAQRTKSGSSRSPAAGKKGSPPQKSQPASAKGSSSSGVKGKPSPAPVAGKKRSRKAAVESEQEEEEEEVGDGDSDDDDSDDNVKQNRKGKGQGNGKNGKKGRAVLNASDVDSEVERDIEQAIAEAARALARSKSKPAQSVLHLLSWFRVILDEAHLIKDRSTSTAKAVFNLVSLNKWCLTGTPLQNRVGELYSLIRFLRIDPHAFYYCRSKGCPCKSLHYRFTQSRCDECSHSVIQHYCHFNKHILNPIKRAGYVSEGRRAMLKLKQQVLDEILLRRTKTTRAEDIQLPPRVVKVRQERLDEKEEDFYQALYTQSQAQFNTYLQSGTVLNNYAHIFDILIRLRQAVDHPYLVIYSEAQSAASKQDASDFLNVTSTAAGAGQDEEVGIKAERGDCDLCHEPWEDPVTAECGHCFCRPCITDYIATVSSNSNSTGGGLRCPDCDAALTIQLHGASSSSKGSNGSGTAVGRGRGRGINSSNSNVTSKSTDDLAAAGSGSVWNAEKAISRRSILDKIDLSLFQSSTKIEALMEELHRMQEEDLGAKAIVFSQFVNMLDLISYRVQRGGISCVKLSGSMSLEQRDKAIAAFKADPAVKVMLISLKAGGVALNLTVASRIFLMDPWWNPAAEMQAIDRTHRIGQFKPIYATRFIIENTIEERILRLQDKKKLVFDGTVGGDAGSMSKLTVDDMRFLFN